MKNPFRVFFRTMLPIVAISFFLCLKALPQNRYVIDSLKSIVNTSKEDTNKVKLLYELGGQYRSTVPDSALYYYESALEIAESIKAEKFIAQSLIAIGVNLNINGSPDSAARFLERALKIAEKIGDKEKSTTCYLNIGIIYHDQGSYAIAIEYYLKSLKTAKEIDFKKGLSRSYNSLGIAYYDQGSYDESIDYYLKALKIFEEQGDKNNMAACYNNISLVHLELGSYDKAIEYLHKALAINEELDNKRAMSISYLNIGNIYNKQSAQDKAIENYKKSLKLFDELGDKRGMSETIHNLGETYLNQGSFKEANEYFLSALEIYEEIGNKRGIGLIGVNLAKLNISMSDSVAETGSQRLKYLNQAVIFGNKSIESAREMELLPAMREAANVLMIAYKKLGNYKKALEFAEIFITAQDSMFREDKTRAIQEMSTRYETEKKQQQIELQESQIVAKDAMIKQQKIYRNALAVGFFAVTLIVIIIVYAYTQKRKDNRKIVERNEQILEANEELKVLNEAISQQNNEIVDSINYAQRIQSAMLPPETYITELLNENFIFYKPRDIVSGDFYWIKQVNQYIVLVAADCTGHGVPGAFMSMLGISYLNEIVQRREITQANQVLNELRSQIKHSLRQHGQQHESKDGIDIALCVIDIKTNKMQYAGAYNPLYLVQDVQGTPELKEIKADRMPLGYYHGKDKTFINNEIQLEMGDTFYIFSDGFLDQKGGKDNKKFMSKNFKNLLLEINEHPMYVQKEILDKTLSDWMGNNPQMDDILIVGVRV